MPQESSTHTPSREEHVSSHQTLTVNPEPLDPKNRIAAPPFFMEGHGARSLACRECLCVAILRAWPIWQTRLPRCVSHCPCAVTIHRTQSDSGKEGEGQSPPQSYTSQGDGMVA